MRSMLPLGLLGLISVCIGCNRPGNTTFTTAGQKIGSAAPASNDAAKPEARVPEFVLHQDQPEPKQDGPKQPKAEPQRKIRYTADLRLIVDDFSKAETELESAINDSKGMLANSELNSAANAVRTGTWRVRVPVENLQSFRSTVARIGEVELNKLDNEDLTDRYYDLEQHIKNRNAEREALRDLLKEVGKKEIKYYLEIKRELDTVTDDINRKEGQLRLWANLTDLTTCTINMREKQKYLPTKPPEITETPTFGMRAGKTWGESWENFLGFCQGVVLIAIAVVPWLPMLAAFVAGGWLVSRRAIRSRNAPIEVTVVQDGPPKSA